VSTRELYKYLKRGEIPPRTRISNLNLRQQSVYWQARIKKLNEQPRLTSVERDEIRIGSQKIREQEEAERARQQQIEVRKRRLG
jgi:hypothetical protein